MGDRASIELVQEGGSTFIYVHWLAYETPRILDRALERGRQDDPPYMARTIVSEFVRAAGIDDPSGLGITPTYQDGVKWRVDLDKKTVEAPDQETSWNNPGMLSPVSFEQFRSDVAAGKDYGYGM